MVNLRDIAWERRRRRMVNPRDIAGERRRRRRRRKIKMVNPTDIAGERSGRRRMVNPRDIARERRRRRGYRLCLSFVNIFVSTILAERPVTVKEDPRSQSAWTILPAATPR